jgi:hypothetical protein
MDNKVLSYSQTEWKDNKTTEDVKSKMNDLPSNISTSLVTTLPLKDVLDKQSIYNYGCHRDVL